MGTDNVDLDFHADSFHKTMSQTPTPKQSEGPNQMNLINIIIRHTILSVISICFNQGWYLMMIICSFVVNYDGMSDKKHTGIFLMQLCARTVYLMVNVIVLNFNLNINHWIYFRIYKSC